MCTFPVWTILVYLVYLPSESRETERRFFKKINLNNTHTKKMNNTLAPQQDPFLPEGGWHFYKENGITMVPYKQVEEVINNIYKEFKEAIK